MPHSSGGGSHSGGSHGGGSHGGSGSSVRTSNTYFPQSYRYVRYVDGRPRYVYSSSATLNKPQPLWLRIIEWIFLLPFIFIGLYSLTTVYHNPKPLNTHYDRMLDVQDTADVLTDDEEQELFGALDTFATKTGIPTTVLTVNNDVWQPYFDNLETYAYEVYVNNYSDEDHWLVVYSDNGIDRQGDEFCDWYFEGMQGNNTDGILTNEKTNAFNENLTKLLMQKSNTTSKAFIDAFNDLSNTIMKPSINVEILGFALFWNIGVWLIVFIPIINYRRYKDYISCGKAEDQAVRCHEETCEYCGGIYYRGSVLNCPHCGASIPQRQESQSVEDLKRQYDM